MPRRVALATYERAPTLASDDRLLLPELEALGVATVPAIWSDTNVAWHTFDAVIIRSCWDYHLRHGAFFGWLARLEALGVGVWNRPALVLWNGDKRYLLDLAQRGVATIPTVIVPRGADAERVASIALAEGWRCFVLKPAVSASGYETHVFRVPLDDDATAVVSRVLALGDTLVQPFADEVGRDGEYSFTFLDGAFSHATLKRAATGEFRVQAEHGGSDHRVEPGRRLVEQAERVIRALPEAPLYARVDGISRGGAFLLMELELIEPNLYLAHEASAAGRLASAIARRLSVV